MNKQVEIRQNKYSSIKWSELKNYDCNRLKELQGRNISALKNAIINSRFSFPFYVWRRYVVDGAGRVMALLELEAEGYQIPDLPVIEIEAENEKEAKKLVLQASSQHGEVTRESFDLFIEDLDLSQLELSEINIDFDGLSLAEPTEEPEIDFGNIEANQDREKKFKTQTVSCPECEHSFEVQI
jgi:hypothetical protein